MEPQPILDASSGSHEHEVERRDSILRSRDLYVLRLDLVAVLTDGDFFRAVPGNRMTPASV